MSAALRHHKQQLHIGYQSRVGMTTSTTPMNDNRSNNNNESNDDDDDDDNHTNSSHCSLSDEANHHASLSSSSELILNHINNQSSMTTSMQQDLPQHSIGMHCKKYFHGHGWCSGRVIAFIKGRYKVRFERPNVTTGTTTQKDICYEVEELPRLMKTASVIPGTRVEIYWPQERRYYTATIKTEQTRKRENYLICYDDARQKRTSTDREWIDLHRHKFRIIAQPPPEDEVLVPSLVQSTNHTTNLSDIAVPAPPSDPNNDTRNFTPNSDEVGHPKEVMIVQEYQEPKLARNESGSISMGTVVAPLIESVVGATVTTTTRTRSDESSQYMHFVSNVPSNHEDYESTTGTKKGDVAMDASQGGTVASTEPPRTIISMELEEDLKKFDSTDVRTHTFPSCTNQHDFGSPGNSSASTNRSVVLRVPECDAVNVPGLGKSQNESPQNAVQHLKRADQYSLRRVSQETMNDINSKSQPVNALNKTSSSSSDNETEEGEISPCAKGKKIAMSIVDSDDSATEKLTSSNANKMNENDDEEGIVIDPDNDEATKTAICSLIHIGSRVAVYSEFDDQFFPGTITDRKYRGKPFYIEYDDDEAEWIDLRKQRFRLLPSSTTTLSSSSIIMEQNDSNALGTMGYRSTRRSSSMQMSTDGTLPNKQSTKTETAINRRDVTNMKNTYQSKVSTLPTSTKIDSSLKLKRSERSTTKPIRFQDLCDTTDSDEGMKNSKPVRRKKLSIDKKLNQADNDIAKIAIGTRVAVWWGGDQQYYNAVVTRQRTYKKPFYIEYEGTDETEWIDFRRNKFKILPQENAQVPDHEIDTHNNTILNSPKKVNSPHRFRLGSPEITNSLKKKCGADESTTTNKKRKSDTLEETNLQGDVSIDLIDSFSIDDNNKDVCNLITVGTRVSVYWEGDSKYYDGTVTRERKNAQKKHYLEYDDGEAAHWIDFREHWVRLLPSREESTVAHSNSPVTKKQKVEPDVDATMPKSKRSLSDKKVSASAQEVSKRRLKSAGSFDNIETKKACAKKEKAAVKYNSKEKLSKNGSAAVTKKQKVEKAKASVEADRNTDTYKVTVGTRVEVWWDGDARYYKGTVIKLGPNQNKKHFIRYDDNEEEWVYFAHNRVRLLNPTVNVSLPKAVDQVSTKASKIVKRRDDKILSKSADIASTKANNVGITKKIAKAVEREKVENVVKVTGRGSTKKDGSSSSTVAKKGVPKKADVASIVEKSYKKKKVVKPAVKKIESESENSDDSDDSSLSSEDHYAYNDFVYGNVEKLKVGSRVSVWWSAYRRYFDGTIKKIDTSMGCRRPYFIKYDDNDKEWTDLRRRYFRFLD